MNDPSAQNRITGNPQPSAGGMTRLIRTGLVLLDIAFFCALLIAPATWMATRLKFPFLGLRLSISWGWKPLVAPILLIVLRAVLKSISVKRGLHVSGLWERLLFKKLVLLVVPPFLLLLGFEQALKAIGYEAYYPPIVIQDRDGAPDDSGEKGGLVRCPEFRWRFTPGAHWQGRTVNSMGYLDREVDPVKQPGMIRVICMGDSITAQAVPPYSGRLHALLTNAPPTDAPWESFNMAVHGYSSVIGLRLFMKKTRYLEPDIVTLYYGWNDHWFGGRMPDSARIGVRMGRVQGALFEMLRRKRFGQLFLSLAPTERPVAVAREEGYLRVPPEEYRETMIRFVEEIRAAGAIPLLITAPRSERPSEILVHRGNAKSVEEIIRLHDEYIEMTRGVARDTGAEMLDLAAIFDAEDKTPLVSEDGIHLTKVGLTRIAEELYAKLIEITRDPDWQKKAMADVKR